MNTVQKANTATLAALIVVTLLSIAGVITSFHLVELHYKQPGRTLLLMEKIPALSALKNSLPAKYTQPAPVPEEEKPKTVEQEVKDHYDPWGQYKDNGDGTVTPKEQPKQKESCDVNETLTCTKVDESKYSEIAGIGVSVYGVAGYLLLAVLGIIAIIQRSAKPSIFIMMIFAGAWGGFIFSIYLTYLEKYKIGAYCPWCLVSAGLMAVIFIICNIGFAKGILKRFKPVK